MAKRTPETAELERAKEALAAAIRADGEGTHVGTRPTYFEEFGSRLWEPCLDTLNQWWIKGAWTYVMHSTDSQVTAYWRQGEVKVTHNGTERHGLAVRGWY